MLRKMSFGSSFLLALVSCSNSGSCPKPGGPVTGTADTHCIDDAGAQVVQTTSQSSCHPAIDAGSADAGSSSGDYGPTLDNASGDEDNCKYHMSWTSGSVCENSGVVLTVVATNKGDGSPLTGGGMEAEVFLNPTHPSPTPFVTAVEGPPGTYVTQPAKFDAPGQWTVRFHFYETCSDTLPDSPHGHAAFFVNVP
jgi:hypothetical protein